jgi:type I restriction enzyme M protein
MRTSGDQLNKTQTMAALADGMLLDYVSDKEIKDTAKEQVRQKIARAIIHEYGIAPEDMELDFPIRVEGKLKKASIAIFSHGVEHENENVKRLVVTGNAPKLGRKVTRLRMHEQARKELDPLKDLMAACPNCDFGLWTDSLDFFFLRKKAERFDSKFYPVGDWAPWGESQGTRDVHSHARLRAADPEMLLIAFRRCHNFIHGNEGMPKDAAFWQFLYLIFAKMHDEHKSLDDDNYNRQFWAGASEAFEIEGQRDIRARIETLFNEVRKEYKDIFQGSEKITLSDRALAFIVSELSRYDFARTEIDAKGAAYQEIVGNNLRGDRGQYFTPRKAIKLAIGILDPKLDERFLDPACGTGGFLTEAISHQFRKEKESREAAKKNLDDTEEFLSIKDLIIDYTSKYIHGCDFDPFVVRASQMNVVMASNVLGQIFHLNSLEFPNGFLGGVEPAGNAIPFGSIDVIATNPPFGSDIPVTDPNILRQYDLAQRWKPTGTGSFRKDGSTKTSIAPEVLFVERCIQWLRPGGRLAIVLPDGLLGNPGDESIRWWIMRHAYVLASIDLPVETFIVEANVNILTSILVLKKKTQDEIKADDLRDTPLEYPVFMAVAEKVGYDRRGNKLWKRTPDGEEIWRTVEKEESIRIGGIVQKRSLRRKERIPEDDLPVIAAKYKEFRAKYPEPGI